MENSRRKEATRRFLKKISMNHKFKILVINPGSTSTKIAVFIDEEPLFEANLQHSVGQLRRFKRVADQLSFRKRIVLETLMKEKVELKGLDAVVGRGGLMKPVAGGTYKVNRRMVDDLRAGVGWIREHESSLGCLIAHDLARIVKIPAFCVDPVTTDELAPLARISGFPEIERRSLFHALNVRAIARTTSGALGRLPNQANLVIAHMGGGISVGAYRHGRVVDVNNALLGMGPFSPQRAGGLPVGDLIKLCYSGRYKFEELLTRLAKRGGLIGYLGTDDVLRVEERIRKGDKKARLVFEAMAYQIAKEVGAMATALGGKVDAVVFTGRLASSKLLIGWLKGRVSFIAPVMVYPGEEEMESMARGALRVLRGEEKARVYK